MLVTQTCLQCSKNFSAEKKEVNRGRSKFCGLECFFIHRKANKKEKEGIKIEYDALVAQGFDPNSPITMQKAQQQYFAATRPYGATQVASALGDRLAKDQELTNLFKQQRTLEFTGTDAEKKTNAAAIEARRKAVEAEFNAQLGNARGGGGAQPVVNPNVPSPIVGGTLTPGQNGVLNYVPNTK